MEVFPFIVAIVAITTVGGLLRQLIQSRTPKHQAASEQDNDLRFKEMEERIQTLERIVTDQRSSLRSEIDSLAK